MDVSTSQERPRRHLTRLLAPTTGNAAALTPHEQQLLLEDAAACVEKLRKRQSHVPHVEVAFVAAALALLCGRFHKAASKPNPSAAARACGKETKNPKRDVSDWLPQLEQLEAALVAEEAAMEQQRHDKEVEAERQAERQASERDEAARQAALQPRHLPDRTRAELLELYEAARQAAGAEFAPSQAKMQARANEMAAKNISAKKFWDRPGVGDDWETMWRKSATEELTQRALLDAGLHQLTSRYSNCRDAVSCEVCSSTDLCDHKLVATLPAVEVWARNTHWTLGSLTLDTYSWQHIHGFQARLNPHCSYAAYLATKNLSADRP